MRSTPVIIRAARRGVPGWLHVESKRWWPIMAGAEDPPADPPKDPPADPPADPPQDPPKPGEKPPPTQADLDKAYEKLRQVEKERDDLKKQVKPPKTDPPKPEPAKKDPPETGDDPAAKVTDKLRRANLKAALADEGIAGQQAKAAMRLLDGVEYDDDDEPTNLSDALKTAEETFGKQAVRGTSKPKPPGADGGAGGGGGGEGPKLTAEELESAKAFGMTPEEYAEFKSPNPKLPELKKDDKK